MIAGSGRSDIGHPHLTLWRRVSRLVVTTARHWTRVRPSWAAIPGRSNRTDALTQRAAPAFSVGTVRWAGLRAAFGKVALPFWFGWILIFWPDKSLAILGIDARLYQAATNTWLAGGDPWSVTALGVPYGPAPWTLLTYLPTAWLPIDVAAGLWMAAGIVASIWVFRRLGVPLWWLMFPPLVEALWNGNSQPIVLAALLVRAPWGVALAGGLKLYGFVPAVVARRWRHLAIAAVVLGLTALVLPWGLYVEHNFGLDTAAHFTWNGSAWRWPPLVPFAAVAIWLLRDRGGEWLAIPVLWPGAQPFYSVFALPALVTRPWLAAAMALPVPLLAPILVIAYAARVTTGGMARAKLLIAVGLSIVVLVIAMLALTSGLLPFGAG